ncbi:hypothetical protein GCM10022291_19000 [Postechiella marina]|uniref:Phospholipid/glycerol acyltransferase domain-containing protein n=1 Tax=Postechiella marina TaxID=943941 RepID=A0ABP8C967_9FLAO
MKNIWLHSVRFYIKLGLFFYYKNIKVINAKYIPKDKPVLFLSNHQNALLDPLLIVTSCNLMPYFLTRAGVFKSDFVSKFLKGLQLLPVYRVRDGWSTIKNNKEIFETSGSLLHSGESLGVFPEGNHSLKRTVRPLSRGFTRVVFETLERFPETDLQIIPIGLNYKKPTCFGDSCTVIYGKPIALKDIDISNKNKAASALKATVFNELKLLTTHIPVENYNKILNVLKTKKANFLNPNAINKFILKGVEVDGFKKEKSSLFVKPLFKVLLIVCLILPYVCWRFVAKPKIKENEFIDTFRFAIAITLVPIWVVLLMLIILVLIGWTFSLAYLIMVLFFALLAVKA